MGSWDVGSFDNDPAGDWSQSMAMSDNLSLVTETLMGITESEEDYLEADVACEALAACEAISRLKGN